MKRIITTIALAMAASAALHADEGMWLPSLISERIGDMQSKGFRLSAEDIYSINQASLKDAVVLFGRGCTGELISPEGLLLTNHHCGYSQIQQHSSVEHDYLKDGFWAMSRDEELPNKGLSVSFLDRMEDVTAAVLKGYSPDMTEEERAAIVKSNSKALIEGASSKEHGLRAIVESLYYGNQYFLFVYREYSDVRLVGAPPSSIGKFGGDTDNWMWPRHTGDFSMFRIYADKDNNPAAYSQDNVPYRPKKYFSISLKGVKEGDFTFIYGFPGRTQEYIHSEAVRYIGEVSDPHKIRLRTIRLGIQKKYMEQSQDIRIRYSSKNASTANAWKKWQGEAKGLVKMRTVQVKKNYEQAFEEWAKGSVYEGLTDSMAQLYHELEPYSYAADYYAETVRAIELTNFAASVASLYKEEEFPEERLHEIAGAFYKDYHLPLDKECFVAMMEEYDRNVPDGFKPEWFRSTVSAHGNVQALADSIFANSIFTQKCTAESLRAEDKERVLSDPAYIFHDTFLQWYNSTIRPHIINIDSRLRLAYRNYMRGQMEYAESVHGPAGRAAFYPDANLTLRVAYGHVGGYSPADGVIYSPSSSLDGIIQKDNPEIFDYNIPQKLRELHACKDYGRWSGDDEKMPVCFIATNHTTGGNSGSPVINADGNLVGINFDRVWEGTMSDIVFDPEICRNIALDIRYVLFTIDKVSGAGHLLEEMTFIEN
ncbi:MAG: S46 family peptidase [Bacteroidales bacterium]|nr:S46 family peptidase [Bacteroidales bacterium]